MFLILYSSNPHPPPVDVRAWYVTLYSPEKVAGGELNHLVDIVLAEAEGDGL